MTKIKDLSQLIDSKYGIDTVERLVFEAISEGYTLTSQIRNRRKELKLTQAQLAERIGVKKSYITRIESGNVDIRLSSFLRILKGLDLDLNSVQTYNRFEKKKDISPDSEEDKPYLYNLVKEVNELFNINTNEQ